MTTAMQTDRIEEVRSLIDKGADINTQRSCPVLRGVNAAPLICAISLGKTEVVKLLLERGAEIEGADSYGNTALQYASGNIELTRLLIDRGANVNNQGRLGDTPLSMAAWGRKSDIVKLLIEKGADISVAVTRLRYCSTCVNCSEGLRALGSTGLGVLEKIKREIESQHPVAKASPAGISKEDVAAIVKAAVEGATSAQKTASSEAPTKHSDIDAPAYKLAEHPNDYALVVGIGKYSDIPEAQFAERDAEAVKDHLIAAGFPSRNVIQLFGEKAGRSAMEKFLETWLPRNVNENSRVFFYFSGHGAPDPKTGEAYLIPWDGDPGFLENTGYPIKRLYEKLGSLKAKEVIVAMDACFSGAGGRSVLAKGARPLVTKVEAAAVPRDLTVFAAASGDQITSTLEDQGHGTFTYYFLKGLSGGAKDAKGAVTAQGLYDYLKPKVQDAARRQNRDQVPVLHAQGDRELVRF
ncbi:MAG: ankyrin repeat domain-containing protein [Elusimicrobia bacterium]|nr:ankyrin repeat domain-containing protein [Elusimicrobiota bacterium]